MKVDQSQAAVSSYAGAKSVPPLAAEAAVQQALATLAALTFETTVREGQVAEPAAAPLPVQELYFACKKELVSTYFDSDFRRRVMDKIAAID